jgi:hypothetical protein
MVIALLQSSERLVEHLLVLRETLDGRTGVPYMSTILTTVEELIFFIAFSSGRGLT